MSNFKLALNKEYEEKLTQRKVNITTIRGEDNQFIGYRYEVEPEERWLVKEEFRELFTPLSKITIEERVHALGSAVADINILVRHDDSELGFRVRTVIDQCIKELKSD